MWASPISLASKVKHLTHELQQENTEIQQLLQKIMQNTKTSQSRSSTPIIAARRTVKKQVLEKPEKAARGSKGRSCTPTKPRSAALSKKSCGSCSKHSLLNCTILEVSNVKLTRTRNTPKPPK